MPNRAILTQAALRHRLGQLAAQFPGTGSLRQDVLTVLRSYRDYVAGIRPDAIHGLISEITDVSQVLYKVVPKPTIITLQRAAERGEVPADRITPRIAALPGTLLRHERGSRSAHESARAALVQPEPAAAAARPWRSVKQPTVRTDRRNCARRPS